MSETSSVRAANGKTYRFHRTHANGNRNAGYVYALGHRIYGVIAPRWDGNKLEYVEEFTAKGKYAFIVAPNTAAVQPETAGV